MKKFIISLFVFAAAMLSGCGGGTNPPSAPSGVTATAGNAQVTVSWTAISGATSYTVYYGTASGVTTSSSSKVAGVVGTTSTVAGLTNDTTYYFVVTASNSAGESAASSQVSAKPEPPVPAAPTGLAGVAGNAQVALSWTAASGAASYNIYWSTTTGVTTSNGTKISGVTATTYTQTGLTNGTAYYYIVTAVNTGGESPASSQVSATPVNPVPAAPTGLTATSGNAQVSLSWTSVTGATTYNVYYGTVAALTKTNGTRIGSLTGTTYTVPSLTNGTVYYFLVTATNAGGESAASTIVSATPTSGNTVAITPGTAATSKLTYSANVALNFSFPATALSQSATATISPLTQAALPTAMGGDNPVDGAASPLSTTGGTFIAAFSITLNPTTITAFNVPVGVNGNVATTITAGTTLYLAQLQNSAWVDVATFVVGANGVFTENLVSVTLPGLLAPGTYLLYQPASGTVISVSNLGVALMTNDGPVMADGAYGMQVIHLYDANGNLLSPPTVNYLDYSGASDLDGTAMTPDGSQGILVDGSNTVRFFSAVQTGVPIASTTTIDISSYGGDGDSVAILPNGDEAVVSGDSYSVLAVVSGILSGKPVVATTIPIPNNRDGLVISNDGKVLLARGPSGTTVFSIASITPKAGSIAGTISHTFTQVTDISSLAGNMEDGRDGMAISPTDSSRAVVINGSSIYLVTGLTSATPVVGTAVALPSGDYGLAATISADGKYAFAGTTSGVVMYKGVDTGTLTQVGSVFAPTYTAAKGTGTASYTLAYTTTLGVTLDNKYLVIGDYNNGAILVAPFTSTGIGTVSTALGGLAVSYNDQLLMH